MNNSRQNYTTSVLILLFFSFISYFYFLFAGAIQFVYRQALPKYLGGGDARVSEESSSSIYTTLNDNHGTSSLPIETDPLKKLFILTFAFTLILYFQIFFTFNFPDS